MTSLLQDSLQEAGSPSPSAREAACVACGDTLAPRVMAHAGATQLRPCVSCGSWTAMPRPTAAAMTALHNATEYSDHPYFEQRRTDDRLRALRCDLVLEAVGGLAETPLAGGRLLDVGCDTGAFLAAAAERLSMEPWGVEVNAWAAARARDRGFTVHDGPIESAPEAFSGFRVITAIDVVEHVAQPEVFLASLCARLEPRGLLYLQTPNPASKVYDVGRLLGRALATKPSAALDRLFPPEHTEYFTAEGLRRLAARTGFEVVRLKQRSLTALELATSPLVRAAVMGLQVLDGITGTEILHAAVLRAGAGR